ncbi:MAG: hypothetical protein M1825_002606, partial [Sarcosagium campestre]
MANARSPTEARKMTEDSSIKNPLQNHPRRGVVEETLLEIGAWTEPFKNRRRRDPALILPENRHQGLPEK